MNDCVIFIFLLLSFISDMFIFYLCSRGSSSKKKVSVASLQQYHAANVSNTGRAAYNTITIHELLPEDKLLVEKSREVKAQPESDILYDCCFYFTFYYRNEFIIYIQTISSKS